MRRPSRLTALGFGVGLVALAPLGCGPRSERFVEEPTHLSTEHLVSGIVGGREAFREDVDAIPGFAGLYGEDCNVVVLVTDSASGVAPAVRARYASRVPTTNESGPCEGRVLVREARYSWRQLAEWYHDRLQLSGSPGVTVHGVNVIRNRIVVGLDRSSGAAAVRRAVEDAGVPQDAVLIGVTGTLPVPSQQPLLFLRAALAPRPGSVSDVEFIVWAGADTVGTARTSKNGLAELHLPGPGLYEVCVRSSVRYALAPGQSRCRPVTAGSVEPVEVTFYLQHHSDE